ncbi:MAG: hypothetical protein NTX72_06275 [Candidatus Uhrbacteria bacterium]|nr:hypothetical protein [Candidatus Uhrbacteria bacterium]
MNRSWLNFYLRCSGFVFNLKQKVVQSENWIVILPSAILLIGSECVLSLTSLPLFLLVSPDSVQESGLFFPKKLKDKSAYQSFMVRRKISLFTAGGAGGIYILKLLIVGIVSAYLLGATPLLAAIQNWDLSTAGNYTYDSAKVEVTGGVARLKDLGSSASGSTANSNFTSNSTGWTYVPNWIHGGGGSNSGNYHAASGNPGGYIDLDEDAQKSKTEASYWYQSFATTVNSPDTATISLDWASLTVGTLASTYKIYVFIDTTSGNPTVGQEVWSSPEITSTTPWASVAPISITAKVPTAGMYYLKIASRISRTASGSLREHNVTGWDNVIVNWSKTTHSYDTSSPTITPTTSLTLTGTKSWNHFTETSTLNGGSINYQLSSDDGVTWQYWNGSAWATAGGSNDNAATVVDAHIATFTKATNKIKWKAFLTSSGTQQVILDNVAVDYTDNALPVISSVSPAQSISTGRVVIPYTLTDADSDPATLSTYEYSLTGAFTGEQVTMTAATGDPSHSGISGLTSSPGGTAHTFVWDAFSQLGAVYNTTVYVRLRANDGVGNSSYAASSVFTVDYVNPVVSSVTAAQTLGSTNVSITYTLADNTSDNLLVEVQASSDNGVTWTVPITSVTGAVGAGQSTGTGKTITWNAGTDYTSHELSTMKIQVRAKDKYQNQGSYVASSAFALDTRAAAVSAQVNLQAQPNAGDTTALLGGSFTEINPNTNDFYVAIDGGAYGTSTAGTVNTASPANQATAVGSTLSGHDYISNVKIIHTDDFGNVTSNENTLPSTLFKYVKPYTPLAPTLSSPLTTQLNVVVNPNASEASDVEYAINETSTGKFVQANGTLGASAVWQTTAVWGTKIVTGLSSPVANYIFKVKSRNPNDAGHAASSESAYSPTAQISNTAPSITLGSISQTTDGTKYVTINYTGTDVQGDINSLTVYEYSRDNATWHTMTEKSGVGSEGTSNLTFLSGGSSHNFKWDIGTDLAGVEDATVYVRLRSSDTLATSTFTTSSAFEIDTTLPVVSSVSASQNSGARMVTVTYTLTDANNSLVDIGISNDGGSTWAVATTTASGHIGSGVTPGSKTITWNAGTDFNTQYNTSMQVRVRARDTFGNQGVYASTSSFTVDTHAPSVANVTAVQDSGADTFTFHYDVSEDAGNVMVGLEVSNDGGSTWATPVTSAAGDIGSGISSGTGKTITWNAGTDYNGHEKTTMKIRVTATDAYSNTSNTSSSNFDLDSLAPRVTSVAAVQILGTTNVSITYTLADQNSSLVEMDISNDAGSTWTVTNTSVTGDIGSSISSGSKTITWNAGADYDEHAQANMRVRVRAKDIFNHQSANTQSVNYALDTLNPATNVIVDLQAQPNAGATTVSVGGSFTETNPNTNDFYVAIDGGDYGSVSAGDTNTASPSNHATSVGGTLDGNDYISKVKMVHADDYGQSVTNENTSPSFQYVKPYTPATPTVSNPTHGTVDVTVTKNALETDGLEYAIFETTQNTYVQADGSLDAGAVWRTTTAWGTETVHGLTNASYTYQFKVKSRNTSDGLHAASSESALSGGASSANQSPSIALNTVAETMDATKYVTIAYTGSDLESESSAIITAQYSRDNAAWHTMTEKSGVGSDGTTGLAFAYMGTSHHFMWDVGTDLANTEDTTTYIRLQANDGTSSGSVVTSDAFTIDTKNPVVSSVAAVQQGGSNNVIFTYTLTDASSSSVALDVSDDAGLTWVVAQTTTTGDVGANISAGSGKSITWNPGVDFSGQEQSDLRVRIRATDDFGNAGANASSANFTIDTESPRISNVTASQDSGLNTVTIHYDIADANTSDVAMDISEDNGLTWGVAKTTLAGAIGSGISTGTNKTVTWNAATDFPNREQSGMMIRVHATDTHNNLSGDVSSSSFGVDTLAPVISNVVASQTLGSNNVVFTYDLSDSGSVNVALDISSNSGSTWVVIDTSVTGAVGAGQTTGTSKTITWNAGTDASNTDLSTMRVRVRGTDGFNNASSNVESSDFLLDTKSPVVLTVADLVSQPVAGSSAATVIGSFTETNPNTNDFYVAIDGGAYSPVSGGDVNTASPSGHVTPIGATLDGNDYISKVKIVHTDDYGHSVTSENTTPSISFKYVKPYTPQAPGVTNPHNTTVDLVSVPNAAETSGLEYAIYETSTSKFVQADGSLSTGAVWRTSVAWGTTTVTGLSSPVAHYHFEEKSRNTSDAAHAVSSESDLSASGSITNSAPVVSITSASQQTASNYALIQYTGTDAQNDTNSLTTFEYSTDNSAWHTMTEKAGVGSDGTSGLIFASAGTAYTFAWDIATDLPNTGDPTVYVRLQSSDTLASSNMEASSAFAIDTLGPVISNILTSQIPGTNLLTFTYDLADSTAANNTVSLLISSDSGLTWSVPTTTLVGDVGSSVSAGLSRTVTWNAGTDFNNQEHSTMRIQIQGTDVYGNAGSAVSSSNFTVDTKGAVVSGVTAAQVDGSNTIQVDYTLSDLSSGGLLVEFSASSDNGSTWTVPVNTYTGEMGAGQTTGTKQFIWNAGVDFANEAHANMKVRVRALDYYGDQGGFTSSSAFALDTKASVVSNVTASQNSGARTVAISYDLADDTSSNLTTELQISEDNGISWTVIQSSVTGAVGSGISTGSGKTITWDAGTDFNGQFQSDMKVRVRAMDRFINQGDYAASSAFTVDTANPVVSNVTASQNTGSDLVTMHYDLADGSSTNLTIALEISSDGGSTWIVPTTSATGHVGSGISTGTAKTITWNAGTDFNNQEISNLRVQVKATDRFTNAGSFVSSSNVAIDTKAPITLATTDLSAQPNAGDTFVLVSGSFTESHPDTNDVSVAIDGGAYYLPSGLDGTASVTNQGVGTGATLRGNDYISKAKIVHTDVFNHGGTNENTALSAAFKYVKPYTPQPLTVENATANSVDVTVNKNPAEVSGLEYAIFESTTSKYVQADGSLNTSAVWQTGAVWSTKTVSGLSSPVSNYLFKAKSRNSADAGHAISSESALSSGASIAATAPSIVLNSYGQSAGNDYVLINYTGIDAQNDISHLATMEFSPNNTNWFPMTEKAGVGSSGTTGLAFTSSGAAFVFAWDAATDLSQVEGDVYVRLVANDGAQDGDIATSSSFPLDLKAPVVSNVSASQSGHNVTVTYDVADVTSSIAVDLEVSSDNGSTWTVSTPSATGAVGSGQTTGVGKTIVWNADVDFDGQFQSDMKIRVRATDSFHHEGSFAESSAFTLDTANPVVSNVTASQLPSSDTVSVTYDLSDDTGTGLNVVFEVSSDNGLTWTVPTTSATGAFGSGQTAEVAKTISWNAGADFNHHYSTGMMVRVRATDSFANEGLYGASSAFTVDTNTPSVSTVTAVQNAGSTNVNIAYDASDDTSNGLTVALEVSDDNGSTWTVGTTSASGSVGNGQSVGTGKAIAWNAKLDFTDQFKSDMKARVRVTDAYGHVQTSSASSAFGLDTTDPVISNLSVAQTAGSNNVTIGYDLSDDTATNLAIALQISSDGGSTWTVTTTSATGSVGSGFSSGAGKIITWDAGTDFANQEVSNMRARLVGTDAFSNTSVNTDSTNVLVDTKDPVGLSSLTNFLNTSTAITLHWNSASDLTFDHYELWFGENEIDVTNRTGAAHSWAVSDDAILANALTSSTTIAGLTITSDVFVRIFAVDAYGHVVTTGDVRVSPPAPPVPITIAGGGGGNGGCSGVGCAPVLPTLPDTIPPTTPIVSTLPSTMNDKAVLISGLAEQSSIIDLYDHGTLIRRLANKTTADGVFAETITFDEGAHVLTVKATDAVGNTSGFSDAVAFTVDLMPPVSVTTPVITTPTETVVVSPPVSIPPPVLGPTLLPAITPSAAAIQQVVGAVELPGLQAPEITNAVATTAVAVPAAGVANAVTGTTFRFSGTTIPNARVAVYLHSTQALVYQTTSDVKGVWTLDHSQQRAELAEGDHSIYAVTIDPNANVKSHASPIRMFTVKKDWLADLFQYLNLHTTLITLGILMVSVLWLFRLKKKGVEQV